MNSALHFEILCGLTILTWPSKSMIYVPCTTVTQIFFLIFKGHDSDTKIISMDPINSKISQI
jgi:hypothetical protein